MMLGLSVPMPGSGVELREAGTKGVGAFMACRRAEAHAVRAGRDLAGQAVPLVPLLDPPRVVPSCPTLTS